MSFAGEAYGTYLNGGFGSTDAEDRDRGTRILLQYHSYMKSRYPNFPMSFADLVGHYQSQPGGRGFLMTLGATANLGGVDGPVSDSQANNAMWTLAVKGNGKIPESWNAYVSVLSDEVSDPYSFINFTDAILYSAEQTFETVTEATKDIGEGAMNIGKTALDITTIVRPLLWLTAGLMVWSMIKNRDQVGGKVLGAVGTAAGAASGGLLALGSAATKKAIQKISE